MVHLFRRKAKPAPAPSISSPSLPTPSESRTYSPSFPAMLLLLQRRPPSDYTAPSSWGGGEPTASGAIQMPYSIPTGAQEDFRRACVAWSRDGFNWPAWADTDIGKRLIRGEEGSIEQASVEEIGALCTAMVRSDRFCEGAFAGYCEAGMAGRVLKRVEELWEDEKRGRRDWGEGKCDGEGKGQEKRGEVGGTGGADVKKT